MNGIEYQQVDMDDYRSKAWERRTKSGRLASQIEREELEQYFHTPVDVAAQQMGVGLTKLKAICRTYDISRWPYRRVRRLQFLAQRIVAGHGSAQDQSDIKYLLYELDLPATSPLWHNLQIDFNQLLYELKRYEDNPELLPGGHGDVKPYRPSDEDEAAEGLQYLAKVAAGESSDSQQDEDVEQLDSKVRHQSRLTLSDYLARHNIKVGPPASHPPEVRINAHTGIPPGMFGSGPAFSHAHSAAVRHVSPGRVSSTQQQAEVYTSAGGSPSVPINSAVAYLTQLLQRGGDEAGTTACAAETATSPCVANEGSDDAVTNTDPALPAAQQQQQGNVQPADGDKVTAGLDHWFQAHVPAEATTANEAADAMDSAPNGARECGAEAATPLSVPWPPRKRLRKDHPEVHVSPSGGRKLMQMLSLPLDCTTVRIHTLPPELQAVLAPMFVAWLKDLLLPDA